MSDQQQYHFVFTLYAANANVDTSTLVLKGIDTKIAYMTARPGRDRAFITAQRFINTWLAHSTAFEQDLPEVGIIYSAMKLNSTKETEAIPIILHKPKKIRDNEWQFQLKNKAHMLKGEYQDVILFIDWLPALQCPEPIKLLVPSLFNGRDCQ